MFDSLPDPRSLADADDATVVAAIEGWARAEAAAAARRLAAIAELMDRRCNDEDDDRALWACDNWDSAAAEVAAALGITHRRASGQMRLASALHDRLPSVAALFHDGTINARVFSTIAWRTQLVEHGAALTLIDGGVAEHASKWGPLSDNALNLAIDAVLEQHDPDARRRFHTAARGRDVQFGKPEDSTGTASIWGRLNATDAALLDRRLAAMARSVCHDDPRTTGERRADALGAVAAGSDRLACQCGKPDCHNTGNDARAGSVVIHVVADASSVQAESSSTPTKGKPGFKAALVVGGGVVPTPLLSELIRSGAKVSPLRTPCPTPEKQYRPSAKLSAFIRARDLTCRFPGCNVPADHCDIDHAIAYPEGPTHPSGLRCMCRKHHLLLTFWTGAGGWNSEQHTDGTITWTTPAGRTYTTHPGSRIPFPGWDVTTAPLPPPNSTRPTPANRGLMMPRRRRTRAADYSQRVKAERALNDTS